MVSKKFITAMIAASVILVMGAIGCSNKSIVSTDTKKTVSSIDKEKTDEIEKGLTDFYNKQVKEFKEAPEVADNIKKNVEKNAPILKDLNKKASIYCGNSFYVETEIKDGGVNGSSIVKEYYQDGNHRSEELDLYNGKLKYLNLYNKEEDTFYKYDASKDNLEKITSASQKKDNMTSVYKYGYFIHGNNAIMGDLKTIDYNGKKAVYSHFTSVDKKDQSKYESEYWYDTETGIMIKSLEKDTDKFNQIQMNSPRKYVVKPNQKFDKSVFKYDPNNKIVKDFKAK